MVYCITFLRNYQKIPRTQGRSIWIKHFFARNSDILQNDLPSKPYELYSLFYLS